MEAKAVSLHSYNTGIHLPVMATAAHLVLPMVVHTTNNDKERSLSLLSNVHVPFACAWVVLTIIIKDVHERCFTSTINHHCGVSWSQVKKEALITLWNIVVQYCDVYTHFWNCWCSKEQCHVKSFIVFPSCITGERIHKGLILSMQSSWWYE